MIRGKKSVVKSKPHPSSTRRARVEQWPLVSKWKLWYEVTTNIKWSGMHKLENNFNAGEK